MKNGKQASQSATDSRRTFWTRAEAEQVLDEWATSGESLTAFARGRGIVPQRLAWWRKRLAIAPCRSETASKGSGALARFIPVAVRPVALQTASAEAMATVELGGGLRVALRTLDGDSAAWVASLVKALGAAS